MTSLKKPKVKQTIGKVEQIDFPTLGIVSLPARIDTGARRTAVWASSIQERNGILNVVFLGKEHPQYTGEVHTFEHFTQGGVASSNGQVEIRYKVRVPMRLSGRRIRTTITLTDRSTQSYPVLVGRNALHGKFVVDVERGAMLPEEKQRNKMLDTLTEQSEAAS